VVHRGSSKVYTTEIADILAGKSPNFPWKSVFAKFVFEMTYYIVSFDGCRFLCGALQMLQKIERLCTSRMRMKQRFNDFLKFDRRTSS
jgi:hypothetical protein